MTAAGDTSLPKLGRYELITPIGRGGMAEVKLALQRGPGGFEKLVVVKLVHDSLASQKPFVDMLLDEARVAALVQHPNVVDIYDVGEADGRYFIAMEYLEGEPLLDVLRAGRDGKRLDPLSTARLIADTAEGLDAAHELRSMGGEPMRLVHDDVSLGNIVVLYSGQVKLVDFGVAKAARTTASLQFQGKLGYAAPEKLRGQVGDRRSDIWALGVVLWEALTLRRLFKGTSERDTIALVCEYKIPRPSVVNPEVPPELDAIVLRALERDPERRYARAKKLAQDLETVLRRHGYASRNDQIAAYMQTTFARALDARKRLLQEVSTKGRPSAAVLEAVFADPAPAPARGFRATGEFSVRFREPSTAPPLGGEPAGDEPVLLVARRTSRAADDDAPTVVDPPPPAVAAPPPEARVERSEIALGDIFDNVQHTPRPGPPRAAAPSPELAPPSIRIRPGRTTGDLATRALAQPHVMAPSVALRVERRGGAYVVAIAALVVMAAIATWLMIAG